VDWGGLTGTRSGIWTALGRDVLTRSSADEIRQFELCRYMWWGRHLVVSTGFLLGLLQDGWVRAQWLSGAMLLAQVVAHLSARRWPRRAGVVAVLDAGVFLALSALGLAPVLVLFIGVMVLGWAATFRPIPAVGAYLEVLGAVGLMVHHQRDLNPAPVVAAYCLLGGIFMLRIIRLNIAARLVAEREDLVGERVDAIVWEQIGTGGGLKVSPAAQRMLGYPVSRWAEPGFWFSLVHPEDREFAELNDSSPRGPSLFRIRHEDGSWRWMENRVSSVIDRQGRHVFFAGVLLDRTGQVEAEREALVFGELVAQSPIGHLLVKCLSQGRVIGEINPACTAVLGTADSAIGSSLEEHPVLGSDVLNVLLGEADGDGAADTAGIELIGADGRTYHAVGRRLDRMTCAVDFLDVTERVEHGKVLHDQARTDDLTGLPNRRAFLEFLVETLADGSGTTALFMLDLDDFKEINDSLGHSTGDDMLRRVSERLLKAVRPGALVTRLGGDEFAVIVSDIDPAEVAGSAARIAELVNQPVYIEDLRLRVRASVGIALYPQDADSVDELVRCADIAMYRAKAHGREPLRYDSSNDLYGTERLTLLGDLDTAISQGDLLLNHQPLFEVATGRMMGTEALVRWQHPRLGLIPPVRFIELAEVSGQVKRLTRWVIRRALTEIASLGPDWDQIDVSVNLSVRNLYEADLVPWLTATLDELGVSGERLIAEITESMIMVDYPAAADMIEQLRSIGVRTWIDDFGMGHSSLARLRQLPVDGVKIDRSFVAGVPGAPRDQRILRSLIELASSLGLHSLAEGVEHTDCLVALRELGCSAVQGHLLAPPVPIRDLKLLRLPEISPSGAESSREAEARVPVPRSAIPLVPGPAQGT
jgi:diguanylate cyclase (GGDEF)-like protein/PAS domain S-box-containing protein